MDGRSGILAHLVVVWGLVALAPAAVPAQDTELRPEEEEPETIDFGPGFASRFGRGQLLEQLRTGTIDEQIAAARELGRRGNPNAVPALLELLEGEAALSSGPVIEAVVDALGEIGDRRAVPLLLELLDDRRPAQRAAIRALGRIGDERALDPIADLLGNRTVTDEVIEALAHLGPRALMRGVGLLRRPGTAGPACLLLARLGDRRATWPMVQALNAPQSQVRRQCAQALGQLGDPRAQRPLLALLEDPDVSVRRHALNALIELADGSMGPVLASLIDDPEFGSMVVLALRGPTAVEAVPELARRAASDPSPSQAEAVAALGRIGGAEAARALGELLRSAYSDLRFQAATGLARIGPEHGQAPLLRSARTDGPGRVEGLRGLGDLYRPIPLLDEDREVPPEVGRLARAALASESPEVAAAGAYLTGAIRDPDGLGGLVRLLSRPEPLLRAQAATALGWMASPEACAPVRAALADPSGEVRAAAAWAAGELRCRSAEPELIAILEGGTDREAGNAAWAAGAIRARGAIPILRRRLTEGGPAVRANAALALGELGDGRAGRIIRRRLRQEGSDVVRAAMIDALGRLGDPESVPLLAELSRDEGELGQLASDALRALDQERRLPARRGPETFRVRLVDDAGEPLRGVWYAVALPDHRVLAGVTDLGGEIAVPGLPAGACTLGVGRNP